MVNDRYIPDAYLSRPMEMPYDDCCKVGAALNQFRPETPGESDMNDELEWRWLGENNRSENGLEALTTWFNKQLLKSAYLEQGRDISDRQLQGDYEQLTGDAPHIEILNDLAQDEIDGESLRDSIVSDTTVYRHLKNCIDVDKSPQKSDPKDVLDDKIRYGENVLRQSATVALDRLDSEGLIDGASDASIAIETYIECPVCYKQVSIQTAYEQGYVCEHTQSD